MRALDSRAGLCATIPLSAVAPQTSFWVINCNSC